MGVPRARSQTNMTLPCYAINNNAPAHITSAMYVIIWFAYDRVTRKVRGQLRLSNIAEHVYIIYHQAI